LWSGRCWRVAGRPAKLGESSLAVDAFGVVSSGDQELAGDLGANAVQFH
jgi:hypothetical protein